MSTTAQTVAAASDNPLTALIGTVGLVLIAWITGRGAHRAQAKKDARDAPSESQENPWHALAGAWSLNARLRSALVRVNDYAQRKSTPEDPAPRVAPDLLKE